MRACVGAGQPRAQGQARAGFGPARGAGLSQPRAALASARLSLHGACREHIDHVVYLLLGSLSDGGGEEGNRVGDALAVGAPAADIVLELKLDAAVTRGEGVRVPSMTVEELLRDTESLLLLSLPTAAVVSGFGARDTESRVFAPRGASECR